MQKNNHNHNHKILSADIETFSDIDLGKCGVYRYVEGDFHILLFAYAFDDEPVKIIDLACGETLPQEVVDAIFDPTIIKAAWNAAFERTCLSKYFGVQLSPDSWRCSMVHSASLSLPLKLKTAAEVLKVSEQKDSAGERLIKYFSVPCKPTKKNGGRTRNLPEHEANPGDWQKFKDYCVQDVRTERAIRKWLEKFPIPEHEWDFYHMDQRINDRGVMIDTELVTQAIKCDQIQAESMKHRACELTGLENPNSVVQLKAWLTERGIPVESLGKANVAAMITDLDNKNCLEAAPKSGQNQEVLEMLKLRLQMAKSSIKKYQAAERCVCQDGRARGLFQFSGANRTARWAGRFIQLQNLVRNELSTLNEARELIKMGCFEMAASIYGNVPDVLSQLIRTMLIPKPGHEFIVADFSAIEARVLAWLAGEQWRLDAFTRGEDIYCASASAMFGVPVVKHGINGELRQKGKIAELACGYQGGSGALTAMGALDMGLKEDDLPKLIEDWRKANPEIVQFWWDLEAAARETIKNHQDRKVGKIEFQFYENTLWLVLPSGRKLAYINPKLKPNKFGRMSLTYDGLNAANKWDNTESYGGKLAENCTQGTARDLLAEAMWRMEQAGLDIVAHVHDEVVLEVPKGIVTVNDVCKIMNQNPAWAEGLPLASDGYSGSYYRKS
ncbi:MAG: DNA polymerase [Synergistaceae bacterium]|nr:DNA polymerase [Synergistaceae bacterium]